MTDLCKVLPGKEQSSEGCRSGGVVCRSAACHAALRLTRVANPFQSATCRGISKRRKVVNSRVLREVASAGTNACGKCRQTQRLRLNGQGSEKSSEICPKRGPSFFCCDYHTRAADFSTTTPSLELLSLEPWADVR